MEDFMAPLKQLRIWVCWVWKQIENSKPSKKLISSTGGPSGTSGNWSHTWVTYEEAVEAVETIHAAGVGFVIPEGYFFLDADHNLLVHFLFQHFCRFLFRFSHNRSLAGVAAVLFFYCTEFCFIFIAVLHQIHLVFVERRILQF